VEAVAADVDEPAGRWNPAEISSRRDRLIRGANAREEHDEHTHAREHASQLAQ
jgi:hypothetical protein